MKLKKYLFQVLLGFLISTLVFLSLVSFQIGSPTESSRWIYEINTIKSRIAKSINQPKLIVVSGSNGLFGISCKMIQKETEFPCVNGASNAGLQLDYILDFAQNLASERDTVLLALEYGMYKYYNDNTVNDVLIDYVLARDSDYIISSNLIRKINLLGSISFKRLTRGIIAKFKPPKKRTDGYQSNTINDYGDETNNREANMTEYHYQRLASEKPTRALLEGGYISSTAGMNLIEQFVNWCRQSNIRVIATWPNTLWFEEYEKPEAEKYFQSIKDFYQSINVRILGEPKDFMYDRSFFYDTIYHLNDRGTRIRTKKLIELLSPYLVI